MKAFTLKYTSRCRSCGTELMAGTVAYGRRSDANGKWDILCPSCYKKMIDEVTVSDSVKLLSSDDSNIVPAPSQASRFSMSVIKEMALWRTT